MANATLVNFASGETSPKSRGRFDIASYASSCRKMENFIAEVQGSARFRSGFKHIDNTYKNKVARLIPYQISEGSAFMLEFTPNRLRVFENQVPVAQEAAGLDPTATYTPASAIVQLGRGVSWIGGPGGVSSGGFVSFYSDIVETGALANPIVLSLVNTANPTLSILVPDANTVTVGLSTNTANNTAAAIQVLLRAANPAYANWRVAESPGWVAAGRRNAPGPYVAQMKDCGNTLQRFAAVGTVAGDANNTINTPFPYIRPDLAINETYWTAETDYVIPTPYLASDLPTLQVAQTSEVMYITHRRHAPRSLTRDSTGRWTLATYSRTNDPLVAGAAVNINAITLDAAGVLVGFASAPVLYEDQDYAFASIVGTTELNTKSYYLEIDYAPPVGITRAWLIDPLTGARLSSAGLTPYTSGGTATPAADHPIGTALYEGRLFFLGTNRRPRTILGSRSPETTTGASRLADFTGGTDPDHAVFFTLSPLNGVADYIVWGGGTSKYLIVGTFGGVFRVSGSGTDEVITPSSISVKQIDSFGCEPATPTVAGSQVYFIQRSGTTLRAIKYDADVDDFVSVDMCINADQIAYSPLESVVFRAGNPDALWVVRDDGQLASMTVNRSEGVAGWHRHRVGGVAAKTLNAAVLPRTDGTDYLYAVTERTVNGVTRRAVEVLADDVVYPDPEDYFTSEGNEATDTATYQAAVLALQKTAVHLDACETYNGTPATVISGLTHLEGERVAVVADGVVYSDGQTDDYPTVTVASGAITLATAASVVHVGLPYNGYLKTQNLEMGGRTGPAQAKPRNIVALAIRFLNSLGCEYGTDLYHMTPLGVATYVFSGIKKLLYSDSWSFDAAEKHVVVAQRLPLPCVVQFVDIEYETGDE